MTEKVVEFGFVCFSVGQKRYYPFLGGVFGAGFEG